MENQILLYLCSIFYTGLAIFHIFFWKLFKWNKSLKSLSMGDRAIMQMLNIVLIVILLIMAAIFVFFQPELIGTGLGRFLISGLLLVWIIRLILQFIFLRINHQLVHITTAVFSLAVILHLLIIIKL